MKPLLVVLAFGLLFSASALATPPLGQDVIERQQIAFVRSHNLIPNPDPNGEGMAELDSQGRVVRLYDFHNQTVAVWDRTHTEQQATIQFGANAPVINKTPASIEQQLAQRQRDQRREASQVFIIRATPYLDEISVISVAGVCGIIDGLSAGVLRGRVGRSLSMLAAQMGLNGEAEPLITAAQDNIQREFNADKCRSVRADRALILHIKALLY